MGTSRCCVKWARKVIGKGSKMEIRSAEGQNASDRIKIMETLVIDHQVYNYGEVFMACHRLESIPPEQTSRITSEPLVRNLLLDEKVIASTKAYPPTHPWARFQRGEAFESFFSELLEAEKALRNREPLSSDKHPFTGWLDGGPVWGFAASDFVADEEREPNDLSVVLAEEEGTIWINLGEGEETYGLELTPDQADAIGLYLHTLALVLIKEGLPSEEDVPDMSAGFDTQMETIYLNADEDKKMVEISGEDWGGEESGVQITPAQSDEISWQLRELAAMARGTEV